MNAEAAKLNRAQHKITMQGRESLEVHGVTDVISFDESMVVLVTGCGNLALEGRDLHVTTLDTQNGVVEVTGRLCGVLYDDRDTENGKKGDKRGRSGRGRLLG